MEEPYSSGALSVMQIPVLEHAEGQTGQGQTVNEGGGAEGEVALILIATGRVADAMTRG